MIGKQKSRHSFTLEEDQKLSELVEKYGERCNWKKIAQKMPNRDARQCRDRWNHYLSPYNNSSDWKIEEDQLLMKLYKENGRKWSSFKSHFPGRTAVNIKSRWYKLNQNVLKSSQIQKNNMMIVNKNNYKSNLLILFTKVKFGSPVLKNVNPFSNNYPMYVSFPNMKSNLRAPQLNNSLISKRIIKNTVVPDKKNVETIPKEIKRNENETKKTNFDEFNDNCDQIIQQTLNEIISSKSFEDEDDFMNYFEPDPQNNFFSDVF